MSTNIPQNGGAPPPELLQAIEQARNALKDREGVFGVEAGRLFSNGWPTSMPAVVVKVRRKIPLAELLPDERVPRQFGGFRVDVVAADTFQQLAALAPASGGGNGAGALFDFNPAAALKLTYQPLPGNPIDEEFHLTKPILCHASPDAGWPVLQKFLAGVNDQLTIAMYDFNADYIARGLIEAVQSSGAGVELVLDPARNDVEVKIQTRLAKTLKTGYKVALASLGNGGLFDSAYHEKVIVRDGKAFWLSSGNFSTSSQPNIDPFGPNPPAGNIYGLGNRDWHVVVQDVRLAQLFERYIRRDFVDSAAVPAPSAVIMPDLLFPQDMFAEALAAPAHLPPPVAPRALPTPDQLPVRVQPLLTPDNYIGHIQTLVEGAQKSLYIQLQYIHPSARDEDKEFAKLIRTVGQKTRQPGFDVRIIVGSRDARTYIDRLTNDWGYDGAKIRVQDRVHNKGIIVDGERVVVGSHNWSGDGTLRNRDASLIIYNAQVAQYYQNIFLSDWQFLAQQDVQEDLTPMLVMPGEPTPPGMIRMAWHSYYED